MATTHMQRKSRLRTRTRRAASLNMISLMDIFTILVFFLLTNSSEVEVLPSSRLVQLPESVSQQQPKETLLVLVNNDDILVQGKTVAHVSDVQGSNQLVIESLKQALLALNTPLLIQPEDAGEARRITIMGDRQVPYEILKKVIATCNEANFNRISLAVTRKMTDVESSS